MPITPQYAGKYGDPWPINLDTDSSTDSLGSLTAAAITIVVTNTTTGTATTHNNDGSISILSGTPAQIQWQPGVLADWPIAGRYSMQALVLLGTGQTRPYDPLFFEVL